MPRSHLSPDQIRAIFVSTEPHRDLMARYGVSRGTIWNVQSRTTHARLTADLTRPEPSPRPIPVESQPRGRPRVALSDEQIRAIYTSSLKASEIAIQFKVSPDTIYMIRRRRTYRDLTEDLGRAPVRRGPAPKRKPKPEPQPVRPNIVISLTDDQIKAIFISADSDLIEAKRYGVKAGLIRNIRDRSIFAYTTMDLRRPRAKAKPTTLPRPELKSNPTPGIDFADLASLHQNLKRPKGAKGTIRFRADYKDAPTIVAYLIPLTS